MQGKIAWIFRGVLPNLSSFTSFQSVIYLLPIFIFLYAITPKKVKKYYLLVASYVFYFLVNGGMLIYLIVSTFLMHYFAIWIERLQLQMKEALAVTEKENKKAVKKKYVLRQRGVLVLAVLLHIGALVVLKYTGFFVTNINRIIDATGSNNFLAIPNFLVPIGISFFSLQALSYILDVYREASQRRTTTFCVLHFFLGISLKSLKVLSAATIKRHNNFGTQNQSIQRTLHSAHSAYSLV